VSSVLLGAGELSARTLLGGGLILLASLLALASFSKHSSVAPEQADQRE